MQRQDVLRFMYNNFSTLHLNVIAPSNTLQHSFNYGEVVIFNLYFRVTSREFLPKKTDLQGKYILSYTAIHKQISLIKR
jgi:hypothetical protein